MATHFAAKTLSLVQVMSLNDTEAEALFRKVRWSETSGEPVCPKCGSAKAYECKRTKMGPRWRCAQKECRADFTIISGTLFAHHKLSLRVYLAAIAIFTNEVKGKSMLALSRDLGTHYMTAFVMSHKLREAMAIEMKGRTVGGFGKVAEVDGGYFGGYQKSANYREHRRDRRLAVNQNGKRKCVVIVRERNGNSLPGVFPNEAAALSFIRSRLERGTTLHADEAGSWNDLHSRYEMHRINHQEAYSVACFCARDEGEAVD